jgi:signal transduction histidine kinase
MHHTKWFLHPILIFITSIVALGTSLILYIYWYVEVSHGLRSLLAKTNIDTQQALASETWVVVMVLSILVGLILLGILMIFIYSQKTLRLYRTQNNFINNFTHELKTPVTSLKLFLETFNKHELSRDAQLKYVQYMIADVSRLTDTIDRILNCAKIESKSYAGEFVDLELVQFIRRFLKNNAHLFENCTISVKNPSKGAYPLRLNPSLFEMLLMNLLTNAIKYNDAQHPRVEIAFKRRGRKLEVTFSDNGIGFDKSEIKKIFRKFYQIGNVDSMAAKGSGLGLHLVQIIARIHKGRITAASKGSGQGSRFTLTLPFTGHQWKRT